MSKQSSSLWRCSLVATYLLSYNSALLHFSPVTKFTKDVCHSGVQCWVEGQGYIGRGGKSPAGLTTTTSKISTNMETVSVSQAKKAVKPSRGTQTRPVP